MSFDVIIVIDSEVSEETFAKIEAIEGVWDVRGADPAIVNVNEAFFWDDYQRGNWSVIRRILIEVRALATDIRYGTISWDDLVPVTDEVLTHLDALWAANPRSKTT